MFLKKTLCVIIGITQFHFSSGSTTHNRNCFGDDKKEKRTQPENDNLAFRNSSSLFQSFSTAFFCGHFFYPHFFDHCATNCSVPVNLSNRVLSSEVNSVISSNHNKQTEKQTGEKRNKKPRRKEKSRHFHLAR